MCTNKVLHEKDKNFYLQTFKRYPIAFEKGDGCYLWDVEGNKYLDMLAGIAVNSLGYCHPKHTHAIKQQADKMLHVSNFFVNLPQLELSQKLTEISSMDRVFFTNSGAESVEGAIKIARKYAHSIGRGGEIISFENSFHGRTLATIATGKKQYQKGFEPIPSGFKQIKFNDFEAVKKSVSIQTAAIIIEPIQGEGGINVADKIFLEQLRTFCIEKDIVLIFDEIQCGVGRTGEWFAKDYYGVKPDIMTLAKGLGGGVPIGAILSSEKVSSAMDFGDHGTTFGGNPLACAAALATIDAIEKENILDNVSKMSTLLKQELTELNIPSIKEIKGLGLMLGIEFEFDTKDLVSELLNNGIVTNSTAGNVLRLVPPLIIQENHIKQFIKQLYESLKNLKHVK
ncbi:MAG: aspartate aminotransferase family protein [Marinilabiliales bacterium]|nr:MAG: aspartate aminotransferase family protein [Marinilabiliales bacterium]